MTDKFQFNRRNQFDPVAMINETVELGEQWAENKTAFDSLKDTESSLKSKIFEELKKEGHNSTSAKELIDARKKILTNLDKIKWDDGFYRKDIGWRAIKNENN